MGGEVIENGPKVWAFFVFLLNPFKAWDLYLASEQHDHSSTQCISGTILTSSFVFEHKGVGLEVFYPSSMTGI